MQVGSEGLYYNGIGKMGEEKCFQLYLGGRVVCIWGSIDVGSEEEDDQANWGSGQGCKLGLNIWKRIWVIFSVYVLEFWFDFIFLG